MRFSSVNWTLYLDVENNCVCKSFLLKTMSAALSQINRFQFLYSRNLTLLFPLFFAATPVALSPSVFRRSKLIKRASSFANQGPNQMTRFWIQKLSISLIFLFFLRLVQSTQFEWVFHVCLNRTQITPTVLIGRRCRAARRSVWILTYPKKKGFARARRAASRENVGNVFQPFSSENFRPQREMAKWCK